MKDKFQYSEARGYNLGIARELGVTSALLYNQLLFWAGRSQDDWFFKSLEDLVQELPLSKRSIQTARETLENAGWLQTEVRKANGVPTLHWSIMQFATFHVANSAISDVTNSAISINNKERNKNNTSTTDQQNAQIREIYKLYLTLFIIPIRLKDKFNLTEPGEQTLALLAAKARYKLSPKRREAIVRRLDDAGYPLLRAAVVGYARHRDFQGKRFYLGENDREWFADLEKFICHNYENVEKGANLYEARLTGKKSDPYPQ